MEWVIALTILIALFVLQLFRRKERISNFDKHLAEKKEEKQNWSERNFRTAGEVMDVREKLEKDINEKFENTEEIQLLKEIVDEWAELKIQAFDERRSWVRKPEVHE